MQVLLLIPFHEQEAPYTKTMTHHNDKTKLQLLVIFNLPQVSFQQLQLNAEGGRLLHVVPCHLFHKH